MVLKLKLKIIKTKNLNTMYILRNVSRLTPSLLKQSPYTFDVVWAKSNYMLIELNAKYPEQGEIPDYDLKSVSYQTDGKELYKIQEIQPQEKTVAHQYLRSKIHEYFTQEMFNINHQGAYKDRRDPRYL